MNFGISEHLEGRFVTLGLMAATAANPRCRVLLVSANRCVTPEPVFPLGLAHVNAALRQAGHEVQWVDLLFEPDRLDAVLHDFDPDVVGISVRNIDDVLIGKREVFVAELKGLIAAIQGQPGRRTVLGGSGFSIFPHELLESTGADYGILGEGEMAFVGLLEALAAGKDPSEVPGLVLRRSGAVRTNPADHGSRPSALGPLDWPPRLVSYYQQQGGILNLQTQRGCGHRCCYCTYPVIEGRRHRSRSVEAIVAEFEQVQRLGADYAFVVDSVFNSSPAHVLSVCEALLRHKVKLRWGCFLRPQGLTRELMSLMARAGLAHIEFGSDSFCDDVLAAYQKDFTFQDVLLSTELARAEDVDFCHFIINGGPGETRATMEEGFEHSLRLGGSIIMAVPGMRIYPGTALFERARAEGSLPADSNLLQPAYYLAPGLTLEGVLEQLNGFARRAPNWIVGSFDPGYEKLVTRLRQRGVSGPLWRYFATAQRLWPSNHQNSPPATLE
jgi:radical SAM superfamily enzyme YgiQ (UPF0313 family)